jgi:hypothetical protein
MRHISFCFMVSGVSNEAVSGAPVAVTGVVFDAVLRGTVPDRCLPDVGIHNADDCIATAVPQLGAVRVASLNGKGAEKWGSF